MLIILNLVYLTTCNPAFYTIFRPFFGKLGIKRQYITNYQCITLYYWQLGADKKKPPAFC